MTRLADLAIAALIWLPDTAARVWRWLTTEPACRWANETHEEIIQPRRCCNVTEYGSGLSGSNMHRPDCPAIRRRKDGGA